MTRSETGLRILSVLVGIGLASQPARTQDAITRVSVDSSGNEGDYYSSSAAISSNGRHVAFASDAGNLVANDTNYTTDIFVHDRASGTTVRVSVDSFGIEGDWDSSAPAISQDGRFVAFQSNAANLVQNDTNGIQDIFVHDRDPDGNGIFDEGNGIITRVSVDSTGVEANSNGYAPSLSGDGSLVAFESLAGNLVANDTNNASDVFVHDRRTGTTVRVSIDSSGLEGNGHCWGATVSADGRVVAFTSSANNLVSGDKNQRLDVFVHVLAAGSTERVSTNSTGRGGNGDSFTYFSALSADGRVVVFTSYADNLVTGDTNYDADIFVHDCATGVTERASVDSSGIEGDSFSAAAVVSADGNVVAFHSSSANLDPIDTNGTTDVFVHDRATGHTSVCDRICGFVGDFGAAFPAISGDGALVAFSSDSDNLVVNDTNGWTDVFVRDLAINDDGPAASWSNYGAGFSGTLGIPSLTSSAAPILGTTISVDIGNSLGTWTVGFLIAGGSEASVLTSMGGTLLVGGIALFAPLPIDPGGASLTADLPPDPALCGVVLDAQVLELDGGAARGVSFTPGLELLFGH